MKGRPCPGSPWAQARTRAAVGGSGIAAEVSEGVVVTRDRARRLGVGVDVASSTPVDHRLGTSPFESGALGRMRAIRLRPHLGQERILAREWRMSASNPACQGTRALCLIGCQRWPRFAAVRHYLCPRGSITKDLSCRLPLLPSQKLGLTTSPILKRPMCPPPFVLARFE